MAGLRDVVRALGGRPGVTAVMVVSGDGLTIDASIGYDIGYRLVEVDPMAAPYFTSLNTNNFSHSFRFVLNFGYSLSFDGRR